MQCLPFFVLLLDPANTGGLARRCCTSILSLQVTVDVPYGTGDRDVLRLDLLDGCPKQEKRRCRKYILIHHIRCKFNVLNIQPLPTRILPILTGDGPHIIDLGKRNWHLEPFVGVALTLF